MSLIRSVFSILFLFVFIQQPALSAKPDRTGGGGGKKGSTGDTSEICDQYGNLKGWAKKNHSPDECAATEPAPEPNVAPVIVITSPAYGYSAEYGEQTNFTATATDDEDGDLSLSITWVSSIDGAISSGAILSEGSHTITASVADTGGLTASDSIAISITAPIPVNTAPTVSIVSPVVGTYELGSSFLLVGSASDAEDGDLTDMLVWTSSIEGIINGPIVLSEGVHTISVSVVDSAGLVATADTTVTVVAPVVNTPPTIDITSPVSGTSLEEGYTFLFEAVAVDSEDGDISNTIVWTSSIDGTIANLTTLSIGEHEITATIADSEGLIAQDTLLVSVTAAAITEKPVQITWSTPMYRDDGTPLEIGEIAGYEISLVGANTGEEHIIDVSDGYATSLVTDPVAFDEYTLTMRTYDVDGVYSGESAPLIVVVSDL